MSRWNGEDIALQGPRLIRLPFPFLRHQARAGCCALAFVLAPVAAQTPAPSQAPATSPAPRAFNAQDVLDITRLREQGNTTEALARANTALQLVEAQPRAQAEVIETLSLLIGRIHSDRQEYLLAQTFFEKALEVAQQRLGMNSTRLDAPLLYLAGNLIEQGKLAQAEPHYLRLLAIFEASRGTRHVDLVEPLRALTRLRRLQGQAREAEALIERTRALWQTPSATVFGVKFDGTSHDLQNLAALRYDAKQYAQAEALYLQALKLIEADALEGQARFGAPGNGVLARQADCLERLAIVSERLGKSAEAASQRAQAAQARAAIRAEPLGRPPSWGQSVFAIAP